MSTVLIDGITRDDTIGAATMTTGSGLDDATSGGAYTGTDRAVFQIGIDATGTPDSFIWSLNGAAASASIDITGTAQSLQDGVTITFGATTGHTAGNVWTITIEGDVVVDRSITDGKLVWYIVPEDYSVTAVLLHTVKGHLYTGALSLIGTTNEGEEVTITSSSQLFATMSALKTQEQTDLAADMNSQGATLPDAPTG